MDKDKWWWEYIVGQLSGSIVVQCVSQCLEHLASISVCWCKSQLLPFLIQPTATAYQEDPRVWATNMWQSGWSSRT